MNIAIVGTGYVGLVSGTCFADTGATVTCVDVDAKKIERLKSGQIPIYEPGSSEPAIIFSNVRMDCSTKTSDFKQKEAALTFTLSSS